MAKVKEFALDALRTDGWFERIGEGIGSFQALCEIVGERFFAFSIIVGARITALTVDRRSPNQTLVDFVVGGTDSEDLEPQRLTLADFRRRLVGALLIEEDLGADAPTRETDVEAIQLFIGVRYLLLAPIYGYSLQSLVMSGKEGKLVVLHDGEEQTFELEAFRQRVRSLVREELDRVATGSRSAIDLTKDEGAQAPRVACADKLVIGESDDGVAALELAQGVDEAILDPVAHGARGQLKHDLGVHRGLEDRAVLNKIVVDGACVGEVAVVRDGQPAMG